MSTKSLISNHTNFNVWANERIVNWLSNNGTELLYKETSSSFSTIDFTMQHMVRTQRFWTAFLCQEDISNFAWKVHEGAALQTLVDLKSTSVLMKEKFDVFTEADLLQQLKLDMPWAKNELSRYEYIMHVINHSTFHRGQIITMARAIGITEHIPGTDYNIYNCV